MEKKINLPFVGVNQLFLVDVGDVSDANEAFLGWLVDVKSSSQGD